jgi:hypothetical protein
MCFGLFPLAKKRQARDKSLLPPLAVFTSSFERWPASRKLETIPIRAFDGGIAEDVEASGRDSVRRVTLNKSTREDVPFGGDCADTDCTNGCRASRDRAERALM